MLAAVRWGPVLLGVGAGGLAATILSLLLWLLFLAVGLEDAPLAGLTAGVLLGFLTAGYVAGRWVRFANRFHGSVSAFGLAVLVVVVARLGGSPAPTPQVLLLALLAIVLGGVGGTIAGRRQPQQ